MILKTVKKYAYWIYPRLRTKTAIMSKREERKERNKYLIL